jgi:hypothetical protein
MVFLGVILIGVPVFGLLAAILCRGEKLSDVLPPAEANMIPPHR